MKKHLFIFSAILFYFYFPCQLIGYSYEYFSDGYFTSAHILSVNPHDHKILPVRASGEPTSRQTVKELATIHYAQAAINGGFWKLNGQPAGILKINGKWYGTPTKPRGAIGWSKDGNFVLIDRVLTNYHLNECEDKHKIAVIPVTSPSLSDVWNSMDHIVGGTPLLIKNGIKIDDFSIEQTLNSFLNTRHSRTAVGIRESGEWIFVVVDSSFFGLIGGMTIQELTDFMYGLGCVHALNLDGGDSSTMVLEGSVVNEPCGKVEEDEKFVEAVSDAILIN